MLFTVYWLTIKIIYFVAKKKGEKPRNILNEDRHYSAYVPFMPLFIGRYWNSL